MSIWQNAGLEVLWQTDLFAGLPEEAVVPVAEQCRWRDVGAHHLLIDATRKQPHGLYVLAKGGVEVFRTPPDGGVVPLAKLAAVDCFGEFAAINGEPGSASVRSLTPCTVGEIPPAAFRSLLTERPGLSMRVLHKLVNRIQNLDDTVEALHLRNSVRDAQVREVYRQLSLGSL
jgi:CRP/FNR family transcriptional regulator/CRP/FNR family cyclic AMP-dependent transcriptional regulator